MSAMEWVLGIVGGLLGLLVVAAVMGALSPATHTVSRQVRVARPPEELWRTVSDVEAYPTWRPRLKRVEPIEPVELVESLEPVGEREGEGDSRRAWREVGRDGAITMELVDADPPHRMVTRIADPTLPYGGTWTCEITRDGAGSVVRMTEDGEVRNVLFRFASRYVIGHAASLESYLTALAAHHGETVAPTP